MPTDNFLLGEKQSCNKPEEVFYFLVMRHTGKSKTPFPKIKRALNVRLAELDMTRRELARLSGLKYARIQQICSGHVRTGVATQKLIELSLGVPIWSTREEFEALTAVIRSEQGGQASPE